MHADKSCPKKVLSLSFMLEFLLLFEHSIAQHGLNEPAYACMQIPATQPLLILATCQRHPEELPPVLLNFFQPQPPVATSAHYSPSQHDYTLTHQSFNGPQASSAKQVNSVGSCQVIVMESGAKAAPAGSWQEAVSRSAEAAAYAVAVAAAFSFQQKLLELASVLVGKEGLLGSGPRAFHSCNGQSIRPGHSPKGLDADAGRALGPAEGATVQCEVEIEQNPRKVASLGGGAVNENELQRGLELHAEVGFCTFARSWCEKRNRTKQQQRKHRTKQNSTEQNRKIRDRRY